MTASVCIERERKPLHNGLFSAMQMRCAAYGLELRSSFALPGMRPAPATGLPPLELSLTTAAAIDAAWDTPAGPPAWACTLDDGCELKIELGAGGDALFTYGDRARFHLGPGQDTLRCAPSDDTPAWLRVLLGKVLADVALMRGYEGLHAAAVQTPDGVVALAGPSGTGKSTLALELVSRGYPLFADDVLAFAADASPALAYPATPHMNVCAGPVDDGAPAAFGTAPAALGGAPPLADTLATFAGERWIAVRSAACDPRPIRMVVLLSRVPELTPTARRVPASPLHLAPYMLGFNGDRHRQRTRFSRYARLAETGEFVQLAGDQLAPATDQADLIEALLEERPALALAGSAS